MYNKLNLTLITVLFLTLTTAFGQKLEWAKTFGSVENEFSYFNTVDAAGNSYLTGSFRGTIDFDDTGMFSATSKGEEDIYILKLNSDGDILWLKTMGGTLIDKGASIAIDQSGDVYIAGDFQSEDIDFDGTGNNNVSSLGNEDAFLIKYDSDGNFLRLNIFASTGKDAGISLDIDNSNNLLFSGFFSKIVDFNPDKGKVNNLRSAGSFDAFVLKLTSDGDYIWAKAFNGVDWVKGLFVISDANFNVYVTGYFRDTIDVDPAPNIEYMLSAAGMRDFYIVKLNSQGNFIWAGKIGGIDEDRAISMAIDKTNKLYVVGYFADQVDFDIGDDWLGLGTSGDSDIFILKMSDTGDFLWVKKIGAQGNDRAREVIIDDDNGILITGIFQNTVDFDIASNAELATSNGNTDVFLLKLDENGNFVWNQTFGGIGPDESFAMKKDASNNIYLSGVFAADVDFDFGDGENIISSNGERDIFIIKIHGTTVPTLEVENLNLIQLYPNPTINFLSFQSTQKAEKIEIISLSGQKILSVKNKNIINIKNIKAGIYMAVVYFQNGKIATRKFCKL